MPAIPALGDLLLGAALLLLIGGLTLLIFGLQKVNNAVSFFGWHPLSDVVSWCEDLRHDMLVAFSDSWHALIVLLQWAAAIPVSIYHAIVSLFSTHHDQIQHVAHTMVPAAQSAAQDYAHQITGVERDRAGSAELELRRDYAAVSAAEQTLSEYTHGPLQTTIASTAKQAAADAETAAEAKAADDVSALADQVNKAMAAVVAEVDALQQSVTSTIPKAIAASAAAENANISKAQQAEAAALADQVKSLGDQIKAVQIGASGALATAVATLGNKISASQAADASAVAQSLQVEQADTAKQLATIQGTIGIDQANTKSALNTETLAISGTMAASVAAVASITAELDNCMVSACGGPNSLENSLMGLLGLFSTAGELGFVAAAIKDPVGTAQALEGTLTGIYDAGHDTLDALLSL